MTYPYNFEDKIGFSIIRKMLIESCLCTAGVNFANKMSFTSKFETLENRLNQTESFRQILVFDGEFPSNNFFDMTEVLSFLKKEGSSISIEEFFDLMLSLKTIVAIRKYFAAKAEKYPLLNELNYQVIFNELIIEKMQKIIDERGRIKDSASQQLFEIRQRINSLNASMRNKIQQSLNLVKSSGWAREDAEVTIRNGRAVIPVLAADKRKIKGFIHDESRTGQIVYLEPIELFDSNNELRELEIDEKLEISRILEEFVVEIKPEINNLLAAYKYLGLIDFIRAKALVAIKLQAIKPILNKTNYFIWKEARHPLLFLSHAKKNKKIIPLDISLNEKNRILIISGPNAGGKSVCLKTVGILQYMLQCGMLVSMRENSEVRIFQDVFIDIGDEQSIENDLSTYSSHLLNIKNFLENASQESLFLIDEFGTGTEPIIGGAIAESALEELNTKKAFGVVTTHYSNLKAMAKNDNGIVNGAMLFDTKELQPLYKLKIGLPGSSFAFEIARKIGLDEKILQRAKQKSGRKEIDLDQRLQELELEKDKIEKQQKQLEFADNTLKDLVDKYELMNSNLQEQKQNIIHKAKAEAKEVLKDANKLIERSIREIKESQADKQTVKKLRESIDTTKKNIDKVLDKQNTKNRIITTKEIKTTEGIIVTRETPKIGDNVRVIGQETIGVLTELKGNNAAVSFDSIKAFVSLKNIEKVKVKHKKNSINLNQKHNSILKEIYQRSLDFKQNIDIRGMRAEEAIAFIKSWIDEAILINIKELEVIHGTGNGILRQILRDYLSSVKEVQSFSDAHVDSGGSGKTIIKINN